METSPLRVRTYTFGCKVNRFDTASIETALAGREGVRLVGDGEIPDVVVVNTCTVTSAADRQARQLLRRVHREHPAARIVVTGCYAETGSGTLGTLDGVTSVVPIREQGSIPALLGLPAFSTREAAVFDRVEGRTRAILKLQDGCNAYCAFCVLPFVRGRSRSVPLDRVVEQARSYARNGTKEIVVTGTHAGAYGRDLTPRVRLSDALRALADAVPDTALRVSSLEPAGLTRDFIRAVRELPTVRPHFHIPLQSASDSVLRRMNRKYTFRSFEERLQKLAAARPRMGIGTDVIVGFPGETEKDFDSTFEALSRLPVAFLHVFRFSSRPGTRAAALGDGVSDISRYRRMRSLIDLGRRKKTAFHREFLGTVQKVLVETKRDAGGRMEGYTPHYVAVRLEGPDRLMEREIDVRLTRLDGETMAGEAVGSWRKN